jgi:hypothetical protein
LIIIDCKCEEDQFCDLSGVIHNSLGRNEFILRNTADDQENKHGKIGDRIAVSQGTVQGICFGSELRANQDVHTL